MSKESDEMANDRHEALQEWLKDHVLIIPEPKVITLHSFSVDWSDWRNFADRVDSTAWGSSYMITSLAFISLGTLIMQVVL